MVYLVMFTYYISDVVVYFRIFKKYLCDVLLIFLHYMFLFFFPYVFSLDVIICTYVYFIYLFVCVYHIINFTNLKL